MAYEITVKIIVKKHDGKQEEIEINHECDNHTWEEDCYKLGCAVAQNTAKTMLKDIDDEILENRPKDMKSQCFSERTITVRFGEITIQRRLYRDKQGEYHFLLDEYFNWHQYKKATPSLRKALVRLATQDSFESVSKTMGDMLAGVLSDTTIHRILQEISQTAIESEKHEWNLWFNEGKILKGGDRKIPILYTEADGLCVHLQREKDEDGNRQKHYELKSAISYEGWERLSSNEERYRLVNKKVYCHSDNSIPFWEGLSLLWDRHWDLSHLKKIVIGGDDANWINKGEETPYSVRQMDGYHLSRSCRRGWKNGEEIYSAIREGRIRQTLGKTIAREGKQSEKERNHVLKNLDRGIDWRIKVDISQEMGLLGGLGCMESNEDKLYSNRMDKKGMSWRIKGAERMGKAIQLVSNGELEDFCGRKCSQDRFTVDNLSFDLFSYPPEYEHSCSMPAFGSSHSTRPYVRVIRDLTKNDYPII